VGRRGRAAKAGGRWIQRRPRPGGATEGRDLTRRRARAARVRTARRAEGCRPRPGSRRRRRGAGAAPSASPRRGRGRVRAAASAGWSVRRSALSRDPPGAGGAPAPRGSPRRGQDGRGERTLGEETRPEGQRPARPDVGGFDGSAPHVPCRHAAPGSGTLALPTRALDAGFSPATGGRPGGPVRCAPVSAGPLAAAIARASQLGAGPSPCQRSGWRPGDGKWRCPVTARRGANGAAASAIARACARPRRYNSRPVPAGYGCRRAAQPDGRQDIRAPCSPCRHPCPGPCEPAFVIIGFALRPSRRQGWVRPVPGSGGAVGGKSCST
jgi:hypothetical protein